ncbi:MAG TPA: metal-binding protein, partial [Rhodospirillaceae bacterium]|nr:metal-binding protein [Rhodospirillaceae bacterium]
MAISALGRILSAAISGVLAANRDRWPFALPVGMGIGIGLYFLLPSEPPWYAGLLAAGIGILGALAARARPGGLFPLILVGLFVALGFS